MRQPNVQSAVNELSDAITEELQEDGRKPRLDLDQVETNGKAILDTIALAIAAVSGAAAKTELEVHLQVVKLGFGRLLQAKAKYATAVPGQRRYTPQLREVSARLGELCVAIRARYSRRVGKSPLAKGIRDGLGVGETYNVDSPPIARSWAIKQASTLENPDYQNLFKRRGLKPKENAAELRALVADMNHELADGTAAAERKGFVSREVRNEGAWLEIGLERTAGLLEDFKLTEIAEKLEGLVPFKVATSRKGGEEEEEGEDDGEEGDDEESGEGEEGEEDSAERKGRSEAGDEGDEGDEGEEK